ncbi:MAG: hypothetical protein R3B72_22560 [Polyangiaceae bacterium]
MGRIAAYLALFGALTACSSAAPPKAPEGRKLCGWDRLGAAIPMAIEEGTRLGSGARVVTVRIPPALPYRALQETLARAESLVRLKVVVDGEALLPLSRPAPALPEDALLPEETTLVGERRVTRRRGAPRVRVAEVRVGPEGVTLHVENENPRGIELPTARLAEHLAALDPPATAFVVTAAPELPWRDLEPALRAAACHDRAPGEEPHEVLLD